VDIYITFMSFFVKGGIFMAPIALVGALALAIAVERFVTLTRLVVANRRVWDDVEPVLSNADFDAARAKTSKGETIVARLLGVGLARLGAVRRIDDIEKAMRANLMEVIPHLEKRTHYLATFANMSTLAGLLGTIIGLIHAFTAVSNADPADKAELLSASISIGMNCTAFGLMVAIPLVLVHSLLQTKTTELIDSLEMVSVKIVNTIAERSHYARPPVGSAAPAAAAMQVPVPSGA